MGQRHSDHPNIGPLARLAWLGASLVALATFVSFFGRTFWMADLFSNFRVQYFLLLIPVSCLLLYFRSWKTLALSATCMAVNAIPLIPYFHDSVPDRVAASHHPPTVRLLMLNVWSANREFEAVRKTIDANDPDFIVLMEINARWQTELERLSNAYPHAKFVPQAGNFGIAFLSKQPWRKLEIVFSDSMRLPSIIVETGVDQITDEGASNTIQIVATHPTPPLNAKLTRARDRQLLDVASRVRGDIPALMVGDFNVTPWSHQFPQILATAGVTDSAIGFGIWPTWYRMPTFMGGLKIDHVLINPSVQVIRHEVLPNVGSDHRPVVVDFRIH